MKIITTQLQIVFLTVHFFHSYQEFLSVIIRYRVHIRKIVQKVTSLQISFRYVSLRRGSVSTAIRYEKCAQIFVSSVNKNSIRYTIHDARNSYTVQCEHGLRLEAYKMVYAWWN